jgi:glycosyltransferase involved in cell wall biosynthesis
MYIEHEADKSNGCSVSLCICTMNRPDDLNRCLDSVYQSVEKPDEVIVSDDSPDGQPTQAVVARYSGVIYQHGPRRGLGPNRNACIRCAKGSHIIFIDDDVCVSPEFFSVARQAIASVDSKTIITGYEMNYTRGEAEKVTPHNTDFWGLQRVPIQNEYRAIVINATIFPGTLFEQVLFDERLRYGSEEIDVAQHAVALGYRIVYQDDLYVSHYPSPVNREEYKRFIHASRLYATTKAYWQYEHSLLKTLAFVLLAPLQLAGSAVRRGNFKGVWEAFQATALAYRYFLTVPSAVQPKDVKS